jgi:hypothetical protein
MAAMTTIAIAAAVAAAAIAAGGTIYATQQQAAAQKTQAKIAEMQGEQARQEAAAKEQRLRREAARKRGAIEAAYAASGVTSEGSPLAILEETAIDSELDALAARYEGANALWSGRTQGSLLRSQAQATKTAGYFEAGAQLLGGVSRGASYASSAPSTTPKTSDTGYGATGKGLVIRDSHSGLLGGGV